MAQRCLWIWLLFLQTCLEAEGSDTDVFTVIGILGESVTFPLNIEKSQQVVNIVWNSETSVAFVTPGDSGTAPKVTVTHQNYNDRINVSRKNYNLEISNLRMEDSGIYKADINTKTLEGMITTTRHYRLQVFRRLGKPKITQSLMTSVNSTCNVTLTCSVEEEEENVTYSWSPPGEAGNVVRIFWTPDNQELTYTCTAWNPVSNSSDSISAQQLCADTATGLHSRHTGLLSGLAVLFLFILIVPSVLLFLLCKRGQGSFLKSFSKNSDAISKKTIYTYVMVTRDAPPAEGRIYDEIPQSKELPDKEEPVNKVYSTLQTGKMGKTSSQDGKPPGTYENVI
ncbi:SLAM family member 5 isoform X1 [Mirounga angustirostris]|uniref:SLAM family member 5 isoform X1 n=2 Tax=Mirounga angustirostris TaxID=9716 RepID=UPI001E68FB5B|nr:SLAM family member 5 isoform X1 [Mirounga angustirostris]